MTLADHVTGAAATVVFAAGVVFLAYYLRVPWRRSRDRWVRETGWHTTAFTATTTALAGLRVITVVVGGNWTGQTWTRAILLIVVAMIAVWRVSMLVRVRRESRAVPAVPPEEVTR